MSTYFDYLEIMKKKVILNKRDGHHLNSKHWQSRKKDLPIMSPNDFLFQLVLGMVLSDASMYRISIEALVKFEQGARQKEFLFHLFQSIKNYCFMIEPGTRTDSNDKTLVKSYWFKTFSHKTFSVI